MIRKINIFNEMFIKWFLYVTYVYLLYSTYISFIDKKVAGKK
jgi:hypothetical protein